MLNEHFLVLPNTRAAARHPKADPCRHSGNRQQVVDARRGQVGFSHTVHRVTSSHIKLHHIRAPYSIVGGNIQRNKLEEAHHFTKVLVQQKWVLPRSIILVCRALHPDLGRDSMDPAPVSKTRWPEYIANTFPSSPGQGDWREHHGHMPCHGLAGNSHISK